MQRRSAGSATAPLDQAERRIEKGGVDPVHVHVGHALVRIEPAGTALAVLHRVVDDDAVARPDRPGDAQPLRAADNPIPDQQALLAVRVGDQPGCPVAKFRIDVLVPQVERLENMRVRIDDIVLA